MTHYSYQTFSGQTIINTATEGYEWQELLAELALNGEGIIVAHELADDRCRSLAGIKCSALPHQLTRRETMNDQLSKFESDASGQGHCWAPVIEADNPAGIIEELETWEIEDDPSEDDTYTATNGQIYRLAR